MNPHPIPRGWWCAYGLDVHPGPCPLRPKWWNIRDLWNYRRSI